MMGGADVCTARVRPCATAKPWKADRISAGGRMARSITMAKRVSNEHLDDPKGACVGPYWFARDSSETILLIAHRCALADAEEYGDCLTCPHGHYDLWEGWRAGPAPEGLTTIV